MNYVSKLLRELVQVSDGMSRPIAGPDKPGLFAGGNAITEIPNPFTDIEEHFVHGLGYTLVKRVSRKSLGGSDAEIYADPIHESGARIALAYDVPEDEVPYTLAHDRFHLERPYDMGSRLANTPHGKVEELTLNHLRNYDTRAFRTGIRANAERLSDKDPENRKIVKGVMTDPKLRYEIMSEMSRN